MLNSEAIAILKNLLHERSRSLSLKEIHALSLSISYLAQMPMLTFPYPITDYEKPHGAKG